MIGLENVVSLFDGCSGGQLGLVRAGIPYKNYYASEIDYSAKYITRKNFPNTIFVGDVRVLLPEYLPEKVDLLMGGPPCQGLSVAGKGKGLDDPRSKLFWDFIRIKEAVKPRYFMMENVRPSNKEDLDTISNVLGVEPIMINSSLVSAQQRKRYYWTNIQGVTIPEDKGIILKDILEPNAYTEHDKSYCITARYNGAEVFNSYKKKQRTMVWNKPIRVGNISNNKSQGSRVYYIGGKSVCLSANGGGQGAQTGLYEYIKDMARKLTPVECERLQTMPDNYTEGVSMAQRYKMLGNGWTVDVIAHILSFLKKEIKLVA